MGLGARGKKKSRELPPQIAQLAEDSLLEALKQTGVIEDSVILGVTTNMSWWAWVCAPSGKIHKAFGSDVALYFAWMNFFQLWLLIPSLVGGYVYHLRVEEGGSIGERRRCEAGLPGRAAAVARHR